MDDAYANSRSASGERYVDTREVVFDVFVLLVPWALIADAGWIVSLGFACHAHLHRIC
jgi:hypothetical protein